MSVTREDILAVANRREQLSMFEYWSEPEKDPRIVSVQDMVSEYKTTAKQEPNSSRSLYLIEEECSEFFEAAFYNSTTGNKEILKELSDLVYTCYGYAIDAGWNLDEAVRRVHENNMGRMFQDDGTIKRREDGKIMKNPNYPAVNLEDLV